MDVGSPIPGMMPYLSHRTRLRPPPHAAAFERAGPGGSVAGGGAASGSPAEVGGTPDGPDLVLPSGLRIRKLRIGATRVGQAQLQDAIRAAQLLPVAHQRAIAALGIPIELVPVTQLERVAGTTDPVVGATRVVGPDGSAHPERIRVAAFQAQVGSQLGEAVQHEIGHAIAVVTRQDLSEDAAIAYANRY